jgi:dienelactone hydrolase
MSLGDCAAPVEVRYLQERRVGAGRILELRFRSHEIEGEPLWVYALLGLPAAPGPVPGLLHIHGGLQTACPETVSEFAARGYGVLSFDWFGPTAARPPGVTTVFPATIPPIDVRTVPVERARIFHAVHIARRGLSLLASRPEVDGARLGVFGISWGGFMTWLVNGQDRRVKAAIPVFGSGITVAPTKRDRAWRAAFQPEHVAAAQHGAVLFFNGTNDFFGHVADAPRLFGRLTVDHRALLAPNENHGLWPEMLPTAAAWWEWQLKNGPALPVGPRLSLSRAAGQMGVTVVDLAAIRVAVYYSYGTGDRAPGGFWREAKVTGERPFIAVVPLWQGVSRLQVLALAHYADGSALSGFPATREITDTGLNPAPPEVTHRLYDPADGISPWFSQWRWRRTEILPIGGRLEVISAGAEGRSYLRFERGRSLAEGEAGFDLMLRAPSCPLVAKAGLRALELELVFPGGGTVEVTASAAGANDLIETGPNWSARQVVLAQPGAQVVRFAVEDFHGGSPAGQPFDFRSLHQLGLRLSWPDAAQPLVGQIRLV